MFYEWLLADRRALLVTAFLWRFLVHLDCGIKTYFVAASVTQESSLCPLKYEENKRKKSTATQNYA